MARKIVFAIPNRDYAVRLAEYLREVEPGWDLSAFTHEPALRHRLQQPEGVDALIAPPEWVRRVGEPLKRVRRIGVWAEERGVAGGEWPEVAVFQPLPGVAAALRGMLAGAAAAGRGNGQVATVFSASGGAGKTVTALNLVRLAGERGLRALYLNLEPLNATFRLTGTTEPDSLSRLLYALQAEPERFGEQMMRSIRHHPFLRADIVDAPEHPREREAMSPELLESLVARLRETGRYDLIVADPDSGTSPWHARLIGLSDRTVWLVPDDWQSQAKTERLIGYWQEWWQERAAWVQFLRCQGPGLSALRWHLPVPPAAVLPYIPQWKASDDPVRMFGAASFSGALEALLDEWGWETGGKGASADGERRRIRNG
ncbi:hypothetical protein [Cohnella caldifontis]|uniref:hypothetical protein n=1 Tax=Cohnella caldifontis TaxID=3027471 RepID=UPI0023EAD3F6|nr:hypothetical protein [Cohnella sp. YIM B05605]